MNKVYRVFILTLFIPITVTPQLSQKIANKITSQTAMCSALYKNKEGTYHRGYGCGIILNGEYVATCYHVYKDSDSENILSFKVLCNFRTINNKKFTILLMQLWTMCLIKTNTILEIIFLTRWINLRILLF